MPYEIHILKSAQRSLAKIATREQARIIRAVRALAKEPRPKAPWGSAPTPPEFAALYRFRQHNPELHIAKKE